MRSVDTRRGAVWSGAVVLLIAVLPLIGLSRPSYAQDVPPPPAVGAPVLEDPLSGPSLAQPFSCRTGRGGLDYVGEGLRLRLSGACSEGEVVAARGPTIRGLSLMDGEIRLEFKAVSGIEHVRLGINARAQPFTPGALNSPDTVPGSYAVAIEPGLGRVLIGKTPGNSAIERTDMAEILAVDDWNTIAMRLQGPNVWLLVNDQPILFMSDDVLDSGEVSFSLLKLGDVNAGSQRARFDPNDTTEVATVVRNLKISALADGDPARMPTYQRP